MLINFKNKYIFNIRLYNLNTKIYKKNIYILLHYICQ